MSNPNPYAGKQTASKHATRLMRFINEVESRTFRFKSAFGSFDNAQTLTAGDGKVWVRDVSDGTVNVYQADGTLIETWASAYNYRLTWYDGEIFAGIGPSIQVRDESGGFKRSWSAGLTDCGILAVMNDEVYAVDVVSSTSRFIRVFDLDGNLDRSWEIQAGYPGGVNNIQSQQNLGRIVTQEGFYPNYGLFFYDSDGNALGASIGSNWDSSFKSAFAAYDYLILSELDATYNGPIAIVDFFGTGSDFWGSGRYASWIPRGKTRFGYVYYGGVYLETTLSAAMDKATITCFVSSDPGVANGNYILIDDEIMRIDSGAGSTTWYVSRPLLGTELATHDAASPVYVIFSSTTPVLQDGDLANVYSIAFDGTYAYVSCNDSRWAVLNRSIQCFELQQTTFYAYYDATKSSLGTPDGGRNIPALLGLGPDPCAKAKLQHITDMRTAIESIMADHVGSYYYPKWLDSIISVSREMDFADLYLHAMGDRTRYGATGGAQITWTRDRLAMLADPTTYDIDIGEVYELSSRIRNNTYQVGFFH